MNSITTYSSDKPDFSTVKRLAQGRWPEILTSLGIDAGHLRKRHGPCPGCGGKDRFRFDDMEGRGTWVCGQGGDQTAGDGFQLLEHVHGWSRAESLRAVAEVLGLTDHASRQAGGAAPLPPRKPPPDPARENGGRKAKQAKAAALARQVIKAAPKAQADHPYLLRKHLPHQANEQTPAHPFPTLHQWPVEELRRRIGYWPKAGGERLEGEVLIAPVGNWDGLTSLELIDGKGRKTALAGGRKAGCWWPPQAMPESLEHLLIGEGVATVLSACEATGWPGVAALSCGNLKSVAQAMRQRYPEATITILADIGPGQEKAQESAKVIGGHLAAPDFGPERPEGASDFNDLALCRGLEAVREQIMEAITQSNPVTAELSESLGLAITEADLTEPRPEVLDKVRVELEARIEKARIDRRTTRRKLVDEVRVHGFNRAERKALFEMVRKSIQGGELLDRDFRKLPIGKRDARRIINRVADIARTLMERSEKLRALQAADPASEWIRLIETANARTQARKAAEEAKKEPVITINGTPWANPPESGAHVRTRAPRDEERPCYVCYLDWWELHGRRMKPGVYYHGLKEQKGDNPPIPFDEWVCSPLLIVATTRDIHGSNYGRLLWYQVEGRWKSWNMPMSLLGGDGTDVRRELLRDGVLLAPRNRQRLLDYLTAIEPKRKYRAALEVGWHGDTFVLPDQVFGADDVYFQSEKPLTTDFSTAGTLKHWQRQIAVFAVGNAPIAFAIAAAFAGPLLDRVHMNWGGIHYLGGSSIGKTTGLQAAASVWGGPAFMRTWHATANGLEAAAAESNDTCLILDEIGQVSPKDVGNVIYALGNGIGKSRAIVTGHAKAVRRWQTILLSSGEKSLATVITEGGGKAMAGQEVRLLSIPVDGFRHGAFDRLHRFQDGKHLSGHIKGAVKTIYGAAGRLWLTWLVDHLDLDFDGELKTLADTHFQTTDPQEGRAANVFALIALAGELAIEAGILPWPEGTAIDAAKALWDRWREYRGEGPAELRQVIEALQGFIARFRDRFEDLDEPTEQRRVIPDRAGWKKGDRYHFIPAVFQEAIGGQDPTQAKRLLREAGYLLTSRAKGFGYSLRYGSGPKDVQTCVCISNSILAATFEGGYSGYSGYNQETTLLGAVTTPEKKVVTGGYNATAAPSCNHCNHLSEDGGYSRKPHKTSNVTTVTTVTTTYEDTEGDFEKINTSPGFTDLVEDEADRLAGEEKSNGDGRDRGVI